MISRYYTREALNMNGSLILKDAEFHHLSRVMRALEGDIVEVVNGSGTLAKAEITRLTKSEAALHIIAIQSAQETRSRVILAQAIPKNTHLDFILEKATELGVDQIQLFPGQLSLKKEFTPQQQERAFLQTVSAMKQCGRLHLPTLEWIPAITKWKAADHPVLYGDIRPEAPPLLAFLQQQPSFSTITFVVGPESGFTEEEETHLNRIGAKGVKLHHNILRTETAAIFAVGLISTWWT